MTLNNLKRETPIETSYYDLILKPVMEGNLGQEILQIKDMI